MSKAKQSTRKIFEVVALNEYGVYDGEQWFNFSKFGNWRKGQGLAPEEVEEGKKYIFYLDSKNPKFINEIRPENYQEPKKEKETSKTSTPEIVADERDLQIARMNALRHAVEILKHNAEMMQETIHEDDAILLAEKFVKYIISGA